MTRINIRNLAPEDLKEATATDVQLKACLQQFRDHGTRFVGAAVLAWGYQNGLLSYNDFDFLYYRKVKIKGTLSDKQLKYRTDLIQRLRRALESWEAGNEIKPFKRGDKTLKKKPGKSEMKAKQMAARVRLKQELREKRLASKGVS